MHQFVPVELCGYVITNSLYSPFKLYIYLKSSCSGQMKITPAYVNHITKSLGYKSSKTVKNNLKRLLKMNWVGYNKASGYYFIRGYESIRKMHGFKRTSAAELNLNKLDELKEFLITAIIGKLINDKKRKLMGAERQKGRSKQTTGKLPLSFPIASSYLAKILGISINKAFRLKKAAAKKKWIFIKKNIAETGFYQNELKGFLKGNPQLVHRVRLIKEQIMIQEPDIIRATVFFKRRKKIESYKKGIRDQSSLVDPLRKISYI